LRLKFRNLELIIIDEVNINTTTWCWRWRTLVSWVSGCEVNVQH
jgi:hypothetical protein